MNEDTTAKMRKLEEDAGAARDSVKQNFNYIRDIIWKLYSNMKNYYCSRSNICL